MLYFLTDTKVFEATHVKIAIILLFIYFFPFWFGALLIKSKKSKLLVSGMGQNRVFHLSDNISRPKKKEIHGTLFILAHVMVAFCAR